MNTYDVVIIGGGQAGLAMGYYIKNCGLSFIIIDAERQLGDSWRKRYDSLVLFTPRNYSSLPGLQMRGTENDYPTKDEMADYLEYYAKHFNLPIKQDTEVIKLRKENGIFHLLTNHHEIIYSLQVIVATGAFQKPNLPFENRRKKDMYEVHSSKYFKPEQLNNGSVLIVGGGNSGAQIASELVNGRKVTIAINNKLKFLPLRLLGKSIFEWLDLIGLLYAGIDTTRGKWFLRQPAPLFGFELKELIKRNMVQVKPTVIDVDDNHVYFEDNTKSKFDNIIWATGFRPSYKWVEIKGAISKNGNPVQQRGVSQVKGLYFIGLPWQYHRGSALICGVGKDAEYIIPFIMDDVSMSNVIKNSFV